MEQQRLVELALRSLTKELEGIEAARKEIKAEIAALQKKRAGGGRSRARKAAGRKRTMSAAQRRKQSQRMKEIWAKRKKAKTKG